MLLNDQSVMQENMHRFYWIQIFFVTIEKFISRSNDALHFMKRTFLKKKSKRWLKWFSYGRFSIQCSAREPSPVPSPVSIMDKLMRPKRCRINTCWHAYKIEYDRTIPLHTSEWGHTDTATTHRKINIYILPAIILW